MKDILLTEIVAMNNLSTYGYDTGIISQMSFKLVDSVWTTTIAQLITTVSLWRVKAVNLLIIS